MCTPLKHASIDSGFTSLSADGFYSITTSGPTGIVTTAAISGFINPKYVILGVTYAPPGPSSNVTYTATTSVGNTTNISSSFSQDLGFSVSFQAGFKTPTSGTVAGGSASYTATSSTDYTTGSNSSDTTTITKSESVAYKANGTGNAFSPIDSDYDTIWLWLNPEIALSYRAADGSTEAAIQINGYAFDPNDPSGTNGYDVYGVQVGYLNGDFGSNSSVNAILARSWATNQSWPTGEGPGLTANDLATIVAADPLTSASYSDFAGFPETTADGRFTLLPYPPNPITYTQAGPGNGGGLTTTYTMTQMDTQADATGATYQVKQAFGLEESFSENFLSLWSNTETLKQTDTLMWSYSWLNTLTTSITLASALSITGPGCPQTTAPCVPSYTGPGQFLTYQDNLYGTFVFVPSN